MRTLALFALTATAMLAAPASAQTAGPAPMAPVAGTTWHADYAPPPGAYAPPPPGAYAPPPGAYAPPPGGYAPPPGAYAPPPGNYAPPPPPPGAYPPPPGAYPPPPPGTCGNPCTRTFVMNGAPAGPAPMASCVSGCGGGYSSGYGCGGCGPILVSETVTTYPPVVETRTYTTYETYYVKARVRKHKYYRPSAGERG